MSEATDAKNRIQSNIDEIDELADRDLGYLAGFMDADGSISIYEQTDAKSYVAEVTLYNTHEKTIDWLAQKLQDTGSAQKEVTDRKREDWTTEMSVRIRREEDIINFLEAVKPYLVTKKKQAENALKLLKFKKNRDNYHFTEDQVEEMKKYYERQKELNGN